MLKKHVLLIFVILVITGICYVFMNRNYDPLSRYSYYLSEDTRYQILNRLDEREVKYIVDYAIAPNEFTDYLENSSFNAYHIAQYNTARKSLLMLKPTEIVNVVELIYKRDLDLDECIEKYQYLDYYTIMNDLVKK